METLVSSKFSRLLEWLGLDWFPTLVGKRPFRISELPYPQEKEEIREHFDKFVDEERLREAVQHCGGIYNQVEDRIAGIETKADRLISAVSFPSAVVLGAAGYFISLWHNLPYTIAMPSLVTLGVTLLSLLFVVFLARKVSGAGEYTFSEPNPADVFLLAESNTLDVLRKKQPICFTRLQIIPFRRIPKLLT